MIARALAHAQRQQVAARIPDYIRIDPVSARIIDIAPPPPSRVLTIQRVVAEHYGLPLIEMTSRRRSRKVAWPRQVAMYLARELTEQSLPEIGRRFGNRDHSTVIHAIARTEERLATDGELAADVTMLRGAVVLIAPPTERQVQREILRMCGTVFPAALVHHSPNGAQLAGDKASRFRQVGALIGDGMKKGWPDLIVTWNHGVAFLEVKRPKLGRVSPEQKVIHATLREQGHRIAVVTSASEAQALMLDWGVPATGARWARSLYDAASKSEKRYA